MKMLPLNKLPNGDEFPFWDCNTDFSKTYYVDQENLNASDTNPGTQELPFMTIGRAAEVLKPGERVVIGSGKYHEFIRPVRGGEGPDKMISYEAAPGANVVVTGAKVWKTNWVRDYGWNLTGYTTNLTGDPDPNAVVWHGKFRYEDFLYNNPFSMTNMPTHPYGNCPFLFSYLPEESSHWEYLLRRGMLFQDGKQLKQVVYYSDLSRTDGAFWVEDNGIDIHFRLFEDSDPKETVLTYTAFEQLFAPEIPYLGYVRVKGLNFEYVGNGFPGSQRGALSTYCGHHWIIEDNEIRWANSIGMDIGHENPFRYSNEISGHHIVRNNTISDCGISGISGVTCTPERNLNLLIENNKLLRNCWHDVEFLYECAAIKVHSAYHSLIRHNTIIDNGYGTAIWTDYGNKNTRICNNIVINCKNTIFGAIFVEASQTENMVDNNIVWGVGANPLGDLPQRSGSGGHGVYEHDCDYLRVESNFLYNLEGAGVYLNFGDPDRTVFGRGPTGRKHKVKGNIIGNCGLAIVLPDEDNFTDENIFGKIYQDSPLRLRKIYNTYEMLNLEAWRDFHGWEENGRCAEVTASLDVDKLLLTVQIDGVLKVLNLNNEFSICSITA